MTDVDHARTLYEALGGRDVAALAALLAPEFEGEVSDGLPGGGGRVEGPEAMLQFWGRVARTFDVAPRPDEFAPLEGGGVLVLGRYVGHARPTGAPVDASFAHVLRFERGRLSSLRQITDTARWAGALGAT